MCPKSHYKSYILRIWQVERGQQMTVVASLEDSHTNQRTAFPSLPALLAFLEQDANKPDDDHENVPYTQAQKPSES